MGLVAGKDQRDDQIGSDKKTPDDTVAKSIKISNEHDNSAPVLAPKIFRTIFEGDKAEMEVLADKAISETDKVSYEHVNFAPLLAPQTPPEDIIACINQIYKEEVDKVVKRGEI